VILVEALPRTWGTPGRAEQGLATGVLNPGAYGGTPIQHWGSELSLGPWDRVDDNGGVLWGAEVGLRMRVWQDGELIHDEGGSAYPVVPEGGADYRMLLESTPADPAYRLSTSVTGEWTFHARSDVANGSLPPLLDTAWDVRGLDASGSAPATTRVRVSAAYQDGAYDASQVEGARLWWSSDDGATWHRAAVTRTGDGVYDATVKAPAGTEHVSLKVEAWDEAGATVAKTVVRAYAVG
jgi:hypothetical protein